MYVYYFFFTLSLCHRFYLIQCLLYQKLQVKRDGYVFIAIILVLQLNYIFNVFMFTVAFHILVLFCFFINILTLSIKIKIKQETFFSLISSFIKFYHFLIFYIYTFFSNLLFENSISCQVNKPQAKVIKCCTR